MTVIEDHIAALEQARYSGATVKARRRVMLTMPDDPLTMDRELIQEWWKTRQYTPTGEERAASSLSGERSHVRAFYQWCMERGLCSTNPGDFIPKTRQKMTKANPVKEPDLLILLEKADGDMHKMIALAAMAGLRAGEIAVVRWADIDRTAGVLWVRLGKGGKDRSVPLSAGLLGALGDPRDGLIIGHDRSAKAVSAAIERFLRSTGVDATAHKLRARFATRFLAATGDLVATAEAMGHASVSTTSMYATASSDTMRRGAEACGRVG